MMKHVFKINGLYLINLFELYLINNHIVQRNGKLPHFANWPNFATLVSACITGPQWVRKACKLNNIMFCPQDREGGINGGRNYYLSKSFSTLLLIFSFRNITQLINTPYSNTNVFGSWGNITTLLGAHQWHSVGIG